MNVIFLYPGFLYIHVSILILLLFLVNTHRSNDLDTCKTQFHPTPISDPAFGSQAYADTKIFIFLMVKLF